MGRNVDLEFTELALKDDELALRLESQDDELRSTRCSDTDLGRWVHSHEVSFLIETLNLGEDHFAREFPELACLSYQDRQEFAETIQQHCDVCPHCKLKAAYDMEWGGLVRSLLRRHDTLICEGRVPSQKR